MSVLKKVMSFTQKINKKLFLRIKLKPMYQTKSFLVGLTNSVTNSVYKHENRYAKKCTKQTPAFSD